MQYGILLLNQESSLLSAPKGSKTAYLNMEGVVL